MYYQQQAIISRASVYRDHYNHIPACIDRGVAGFRVPDPGYLIMLMKYFLTVCLIEDFGLREVVGRKYPRVCVDGFTSGSMV